MRPEIQAALQRILTWRSSHKRVGVLDPRRLARDLSDLQPNILIAALQSLVHLGMLKQVYQFEEPSGVLVGPDRDSPMEFPSELENRLGERVSLDDGKIVTVYREAV